MDCGMTYLVKQLISLRMFCGRYLRCVCCRRFISATFPPAPIRRRLRPLPGPGSSCGGRPACRTQDRPGELAYVPGRCVIALRRRERKTQREDDRRSEFRTPRLNSQLKNSCALRKGNDPIQKPRGPLSIFEAMPVPNGRNRIM
jgi:hypothetical protein